MKTTQLKTLIKEVIKEVITEIEPYDPESDSFAPGPRNRQEEPNGQNYNETNEINLITQINTISKSLIDMHTSGIDDENKELTDIRQIVNICNNILQMHQKT